MSRAVPSSTTARPSAPGRIPLFKGVAVVAKREVMTTLRSKGFVLSTLIVLGLILLAGLLLPRLGAVMGGTERVAVDPAAAAAVGDTLAAHGFETLQVADPPAARAAVVAGEADAAVVAVDADPAAVPTGSPWLVIGERDVPESLMGALAVTPSVELTDAGAPNEAIVSLIGLGFGLVFMMTAIMFGTAIAQSVVAEKQSRIVEILLAALPARTLLAGKIVGNTLLAFGQIVAYAAAAGVVMAVNGAQLPLEGLGGPIIWFVVLFTIGFVMLAALYGAGASLVSRQEDIASATMPVVFLVMIPYFLIIGFASDLTALKVMSFIPFTAPVAVPMRVYLDDISALGLAASVAITAAAAVGAIALAAAIYRRSVLKTGKAVGWLRALRAEAT